ncbi:sugar phosphate nucleotidyltransferase [Cohnella faecalis]|uniref:Mannose-1-phosphate guanylyltransferase n=1 Tax=Cohnella faecalis TaxID=2315694 RepID=A0A398CHH5_9BACL|nr:sugar phosphate nucleotidyltransferase [Cohnella faecalis]RIE00549.1 mannose-1-phosphate guanylyltransferase [Cohnella faecalis]
MKIVLLSGGAGKRLWPLSSEMLPKQFLKVIKSKYNHSISMIQRTHDILSGKFGTDNVFVAAGLHHHSILAEQLGEDANLILEPSQRDTFAAIAVACSYLSSIGVNPDETIAVLPVDAYVDPDFYDKLEDLDRLIGQDRANLGLIGIRPTYPSEKFGYIIPFAPAGDPSSFDVSRFHEKPETETAAELIEQGALWNGGVFTFRLRYMEETLKRLNQPWDYTELTGSYHQIPRISFDYMVVEPETRIACIRYEGVWTDLGSWTEMIHLLDHDNDSNVIKDGNCDGTYVINQLHLPIIVAGIPNAVIAAGPDGILISDKDYSHLIKPLVDQVESLKSSIGRAENG